MKTLFKTKIALVALAAGLLFSCKNTAGSAQGGMDGDDTDSTQTTTDTIRQRVDTTKVNGTRGTSTDTTGTGTKGN